MESSLCFVMLVNLSVQLAGLYCVPSQFPSPVTALGDELLWEGCGAWFGREVVAYMLCMFSCNLYSQLKNTYVSKSPCWITLCLAISFFLDRSVFLAAKAWFATWKYQPMTQTQYLLSCMPGERRMAAGGQSTLRCLRQSWCWRCRDAAPSCCIGWRGPAFPGAVRNCKKEDCFGTCKEKWLTLLNYLNCKGTAERQVYITKSLAVLAKILRIACSI